MYKLIFLEVNYERNKMLKGLACPQPLILTKKAVESSEEKDFLIIVDNDTAVKNLEKFAKK